MKFGQTIKEYGIGPAGVLAIGFIVAALIGAYAFYSVRSLSNTLTVTGSATATSTADTGKLTVTVSRSASVRLTDLKPFISCIFPSITPLTPSIITTSSN